MIELITRDEALSQIRSMGITTVDNFDQWVPIASALVMDYITETEADWVIEDSSPEEIEVPDSIKGATLLVFGELYKSRESSTCNPMSDFVKLLLRAHRDPPLA